MGRLFSVKLPLAAIFMFLFSAHADEAPDAHELLRAVRMAQTGQEWNLTGQLRVGSVKHPFKLAVAKGAIRYEFTDTGDTLTLRLGEKGSTLEETKGGKSSRVTAAKFNQPVFDTDLSYEDLALRFLYWPEAKVIGDDAIVAHSCWKVEVRPAEKDDSQYTRAVLWIGKDDGALMKAESYDARDKWARRFTVRSVMKRDGLWLLKQMRIESAAGRSADPKPTYLEIEDITK